MILTVSIGGVEMTGASHYVIEDSITHANALGQRDTVTLKIASADGSYKPAIGARIAVWDENGRRFGGSIRQLDVQVFGDALISTIGCASWEQLFDRRFTGERTYTDQTAGAIFQDLLTNCMGGEDLTASIVVDGPVLANVSFNYQTVREAFDQLCAMASDDADTYIWDCTAEKVTRLYKQSSFPAPFDITDLSSEVLQLGGSVRIGASWSLDKYTNRVYPRLSQLIGSERTETFPGDAAQTSFLTTLPLAAAPTIRRVTGGVPAAQTVGERGVVTGKQWYWTRSSNTIDQDEAGTPLATGESLEVVYRSLESQVLPPVQNDAEVAARAAAEGGTGYHSSILDSDMPGTAEDGAARAAAWLGRYSQIPCTVEYPTANPDVRAGQHQAIANTPLGLSAAFLIESVTMTQAGGRYIWRVKAVAGALTGDYKMRLRELRTSESSGGSSIVVSGGGGGATPAAPDSPPNCTLGTITTDATPSNGQRAITIRYSAPSPVGTFLGVYLEIEAPDQTGIRPYTLGSSDLSGSDAASGDRKPLTFGPFAHSAAQGILKVQIPEPESAELPMVCRARLISYSANSVNDALTSPAAAFALEAPPDTPKPRSGVEYADLVTGLTVRTEVRVVGGVSTTYVFTQYTRPADRRFSGVYAVVEYRTAGGDVTANRGIIWDGGGADPSNYFPTPPAQTAKVYALSYHDGASADQVNGYIPGVTPEVAVQLGNPVGPDGREYADDVIDLSCRVLQEWVGGVLRTRVFTRFSPPSDPRWYGVYVGVTYTTDDGDTTTNWGVIQDGTGAYGPSNDFPAPATEQTVTVEVRSYAVIDGTDTVNSGGPTAAITIGTHDGTVDFRKALVSSFDGAEFQVDPVTFKWSMKGVNFSKGFGGFAVGSAAIPEITVAPDGVPMGWIGKDAASGYSGAWFKRVMIGGTSPANAPIVADADGNVAISGAVISGSISSGVAFFGTMTLEKDGILTDISNSLHAGFPCSFYTEQSSGLHPHIAITNGEIYLGNSAHFNLIDISVSGGTNGVIFTTVVGGGSYSWLDGNGWLDLHGSGGQAVKINGVQIIQQRYMVPVSTLADVISVLRWHGLCN